MNAAQRPAEDSLGPTMVPSLRDGLIAVVLFLVFVSAHVHNIHVPAIWVIWFAVGSVQTLSLAWRTWHPLRVWLVTTSCALVLFGSPIPANPFSHDVTTADMTIALVAPLLA